MHVEQLSIKTANTGATLPSQAKQSRPLNVANRIFGSRLAKEAKKEYNIAC
jgi:hypothetical protein